MLDWRWWRRSRARPGVKPSPEYEHWVASALTQTTHLGGPFPGSQATSPAFPPSPWHSQRRGAGGRLQEEPVPWDGDQEALVLSPALP